VTRAFYTDARPCPFNAVSSSVGSVRIYAHLAEEQITLAERHSNSIESQRVSVNLAREHLLAVREKVEKALASLDRLVELIDWTDSSQACAYAEMRR
jgi:hypothetical protein